MTFAVPLRVKVELLIKETGEIKESEIFMGDFPMMTEDGTFVINGAERVVVSQLVRSPGVYFTPVKDPSTGRDLFSAKLIPNRGAWLEFETHSRDVLSVKVDRKRKIPVTILLRAIGYGSDDELMSLFTDVDTNPEHRYLQATIDREPTKSRDEALIELYRRLRPGDPPTPENARNLLDTLLFNPRRYDLARRRAGRRYRPPGQSAYSGRGRTDPEPVSHRPVAHGARGQGAHDDPGSGNGDAERAHQHPAGGGGHARVLWG
jgi:DNA-directed RNA polymerase subunit beta